MKTVAIIYGQTLVDIAVQELGDAERVMEICQLNNLGLTDDLTAGMLIIVPDFDLNKRNLVQLFTDEANRPGTNDTDDLPTGRLEGIDYWRIDFDFVVQ